MSRCTGRRGAVATDRESHRHDVTRPHTFKARGLVLALAKFDPPIYPQFWGDFRYNLSRLDMMLNCGPKARDLIASGHDPA